jgi:hypothetical protein
VGYQSCKSCKSSFCPQQVCCCHMHMNQTTEAFFSQCNFSQRVELNVWKVRVFTVCVLLYSQDAKLERNCYNYSIYCCSLF